jgi:hypothetical protein
MPAVLWALEAALIGCLLAWRYAGLRGLRPRWAAWMLIFASGTAGGIGISSALFFVCRLITTDPLLPMALEILAAAWVLFDLYRRRARAKHTPIKPSAWPFVLAAFLVIALALDTLVISAAWTAIPHGNWDAWAIWNLRARFLAGPATADRAWSPMIEYEHPEYPLLVSGFIARCWTFAGLMTQAAPMAASYLFFLAMLAFGAGGLAVLRDSRLGLLFALALAGTPLIVLEVPAQYADITLACYFMAAIVTMLLDRPALAGLFAGMAAWTKDEGAMFLLIFFLVLAILRREKAKPALAGAAPFVALLVFYKSVLARGTPSLFAQSVPGLAQRLGDPHRYAVVFQAIIGQLKDMFVLGWYHPLWPLLILAVGLGFARAHLRDLLFAGAITAALCVLYFFVYIGTGRDLNWHLSTSLYRLTLHVWPCLMLTVFVALRSVGQPAFLSEPEPSPPPPPVRKKSHKRRAS